MMKWEERMQAWIRRNVLWLAFAALLLLGLYARYAMLPVLVGDLEFMNMGWYKGIKAGGMAGALAPELQWTYSPMHLYVWTLAAKLLGRFSDVYVLKGVSFAMELGLMACCGLLARRTLPKARRPLGLLVAFALLWLSPILVLNVAGWGQTDASYAALSILSLWLLLKDRPAWAMASFGLALAFKLQAIFLLPLFIAAYFAREKKFSVLWFLLIPAVWVATGLPMALIGESPLYAVTVYLGQTDLYTVSTFNCPNLYALLGNALHAELQSVSSVAQASAQSFGMVLAVGALGLMLVWVIRRQVKLSDQTMLLLGSWCVLVCVFFLPRMHERYGLVGEVLLVLWAVCEWKPRAFAYVALGMLPTVSAYCGYMFYEPMFDLQLGAAMNLLLLALLTRELIAAPRRDAAPISPVQETRALS